MTHVRWIIEIGRVWTWEDLPPATVALDGAVQGPRIDAESRRYSFDHHGDCLRLATTATCRQVFDAVLLGLDPAGMTVLLNDLDGDTVLSAWILRHHDRWRDAGARARLWPLLETVAAGDAHGCPYPPPSLDLGAHFHLRVMAGARDARQQGYPKGPVAALQGALRGLESWWRGGLAVQPARAADHTVAPYIIKRFPGWVMVDTDAPGSVPAGRPWPAARRLAGPADIYALGHHRMCLVSRLGGGRYRYTLAKRSDLVSGFPLPRLYDGLNAVEAGRHGAADGSSRWGGGSTIGGGPRTGSVLGPETVASTIADLLARTPRPRGSDKTAAAVSRPAAPG